MPFRLPLPLWLRRDRPTYAGTLLIALRIRGLHHLADTSIEALQATWVAAETALEDALASWKGRVAERSISDPHGGLLTGYVPMANGPDATALDAWLRALLRKIQEGMPAGHEGIVIQAGISHGESLHGRDGAQYIVFGASMNRALRLADEPAASSTLAQIDARTFTGDPHPGWRRTDDGAFEMSVEA